MPSISGVSGTLTHGSSIVLSGSDFGTKAHAGPMLYDAFDDATGDIVSTSDVGREPTIHQGNLASYNAWERDISGSGNPAIARDSTSVKARSTYHARMSFDGDGAPWGIALLIPYSDFTTGNELYISYYNRYNKTSANWGRQYKSWFAFSSGFAADKAYWHPSFGTCQAGDYWRIHRTESTDENSPSPGLGGTEMGGEWARHESYLKQSGAGSSNGAWHQTVYRPTLGTPAKHAVALDNYKMRDSSDDWVLWTFGGAYYDICNNGDTFVVDVDEFVMDSTRARVELADASTWSARTFSEYQVATAWATGEITFTLNAGHFGDTDTAYLYVVDSDGNVNSDGFEVTLGGSGGGSTGGRSVIFLA